LDASPVMKRIYLGVPDVEKAALIGADLDPK
jgi:hypothetical protein